MSDKPTLSDSALSGTTTGYVVDPGTGEKLEATFTDLSDEQEKELDELEQKANGGDADAFDQLLEKVIDDYCQNDVSYEEQGRATQQAIFTGFMRALGDTNEATEEAEEFFDTMEAAQEGNR